MNEFAKKFITDLTAILNAVLSIDADKNKKIELSEVLPLLMVVVTRTMSSYGSIGQALSELEEAFVGEENAGARAELVAVFSANFDLTNDELEELVEDTLSYLVEGYDLVLRYKALAK